MGAGDATDYSVITWVIKRRQIQKRGSDLVEGRGLYGMERSIKKKAFMPHLCARATVLRCPSSLNATNESDELVMWKGVERKSEGHFISCQTSGD